MPAAACTGRGEAPRAQAARPPRRETQLKLVKTQQAPGAQQGGAPSPAPKPCLMCRPTAPGVEDAGSSLITILELLSDDPRFATFANELEGVIEEIQNRSLIDGIDEEELLVIEAASLGYQWDKDIAEYTGIERDRVVYVCERLAAEEPPRLIEEKQGGKPDAARGRRKRLWMTP